MGKTINRALTCIETFSGAGGMALGLLDAGIDVRLAFDIDAQAVKTYRSNIGSHCFEADAFTIDGADLLQQADIGSEGVDILSGGPPCQGFSKQSRGAHIRNDRRNGLVLEFARLVRETKARSFIFENVQIFGQKRGRDFIAEIKQDLSDYTIYTFFICSSDFGLAQARGRFLMIGVLRDLLRTKTIILEPSPYQATIADIIRHLPPPPDDYTEHPDYPNHIKCRITKINEERFSHVPPGGGWQDIPMHLRLPCHQNVDTKKGGWPDVYGRLVWDGQCPTITAGFDSFTRGRYGHPEQNRSLTLREGADLQGFPDQFRFYGTRHDIRLQIGNAVPPPLAKAAGEALIRALRGAHGIPEHVILPEEYEDQLMLAI